MLQIFSTKEWDEHYPDTTQQQAIKSLEGGQILYLPHLAFNLMPDEQKFLSPDIADPGHKNISYDLKTHRLWGMQKLTDEEHTQLKNMLDRFCHQAYGLIQSLLPRYTQQLIIARTSFRPVAIGNNKTSYRKDDQRLHVDSFPSAPVQGKRILRVFSNINPHGENRVWRVGEPFENVANKFMPQCTKPLPGFASLLRLLKITKSYRTAYDHYMLQLHNRMKADEQYQNEVEQQLIHFPSGATWIVQTDHVSHAAMSGQYVLEQTFYLPVKAMQDETKSPLNVLEKMAGVKLV